MKEVILKSIEGGYFFQPLFGGKGEQRVEGNKIITKHAKADGWESESYEDLSDVLKDKKFLLDPLFWQALGKSLGWEKFYIPYKKGQTEWQSQWHSFIDHLAQGKSPDDFFNQLLK